MAPPSTSNKAPDHLQMPIPEPLESQSGLRQADAWPKWSRRFDRYRIASGLSEKANTEQVSTFLYSMGESADDILATLSIDETTISYEDIKKKFDEYFGIRKNTIVERARFNRRTQKVGEPVDAFIQDLFKLAEDCDYGNIKDELIRDRIIVGVLDDSLSDRLQIKPDLKLEDAVRAARQNEARSETKEVVRGDHASSSHPVNQVNKSHYKKSKTAKQHKPRQNPPPQPQATRIKCKWCGYDKHARNVCPAREATCTQCHKKGHYQAVCRGKTINQLEYDEHNAPIHVQPYPGDFLGEITAFIGETRANKSSTHWIETIQVNGKATQFKLDTGAHVSILSDRTPWLEKKMIVQTSDKLYGPGRTVLNLAGVIPSVKLQCNGNEIFETLFVLRDQDVSLLSADACVKLGLVVRNTSNINEITKPDFRQEFPSLFTGLGKLETPYHITLKEDAVPLSLTTPRLVPQPLLPKVEAEIKKMVETGVISPITEPTTWCNPLVPVLKPNGNVRICVDLQVLNKAVKREIHPMATVQDSLAQLADAKVMSKLDANSGFWQIPLDDESKLLTTFITPFGRYYFNRLPFGITSAPEVFQRTMSQILSGLSGVVCHMDDVLIHGKSQEEHDHRVRMVLQRLSKAGITLNEKCEFGKDEMKFLGHIISRDGIQADPNKVKAIKNLDPPRNITELQRFQGMTNQLAKFLPNLSTLNKPLRDLLKKDNAWSWGDAQEKAFNEIKDKLTSTPVLAHYDTRKETIIAADASKYGLGAVLMQIQENGERKPVHYASRSLTETEQRYAVIEKEALAATWACEQFSQYVLGLHFQLETDHNPLVVLFGDKDLSSMPVRIQRFKLRLMRYSFTIRHVPGKYQNTADTLSRAPVQAPTQSDVHFVNEVESFSDMMIMMLPASAKRLEEFIAAQKSDIILNKIREYCEDKWPKYEPEDKTLTPFWQSKEHLSITNDILLYNDRIVVPRQLQQDVLKSIHEGHQGITKCRARARMSVWWPGLSKQIAQLVESCNICKKYQREVKEPLKSSEFPDGPWEKIAMDLFSNRSITYIVVIDYYSRWIECRKLTDTSSAAVINVLKSIFATHGNPLTVVSDNGPQFASALFSEFAKSRNFNHCTSSPRHPSGNGEAERAVATMKSLLNKNADPYLALAAYRTTPLANGLSPSQLLMGRQLRTSLPMTTEKYLPGVDAEQLQLARRREEEMRTNREDTFNRQHRTKPLSSLCEGDEVWIRDMDREGTISRSVHDRSYVVNTPAGELRRNRSALVACGQPSEATPPLPQASPLPPPTPPRDSNVSRYGRALKKTQRLIEEP